MKSFDIKLIKLVIICFFYVISVNGTHLTEIRGKIIIKNQKENLEGINVFLDGTTYFCKTDKNGNFGFDKIPNSRYTVVVSREGYRSKEVFINTYIENEKLSIQLPDEKLVLQNESEELKKDYLDELIEDFFDESEFGEDCKVLNKEVLIFTKNAKNDLILVNSVKPLEIMNNALGYKVYVSLCDYIIDDDIDLSKQKCFTFFEKLETNDIDTKIRWKKNKLLRFDGSKEFFLIKLAQADFNRKLFVINKCNYRNEISDRIDGLRYNELEISSDNSIVFTLPIAEKIAIRHSDGGLDCTNFIQSLSKNLVFDFKGTILNPEKINIEGTWRFVKIPDLLPSNYILDLGR